ncbi:MAG: hypothetical protein NDP13_03150 [Crenarchaeota archaeon]|nr:hypothetical protein [Thermoproteota archaeon]MCR8455209.1 hypothetical protein [Thermoproteota archaeon]
MSASETSIVTRKKHEQRTHQVYDSSPWVSRDELIDRILKTVRRLRILPSDAEELVGMLGKSSVDEITKKMRDKGIPISSYDMWSILERLRAEGYLRVITTKPPEAIAVAVETKVMTPTIETVTPRERPPLESAPISLEIEGKSIEIPVPEVPITAGVHAEIAGAAFVALVPQELQEKINIVKESRILERYFAINEYLKAAAVLSREGNVTLLSMYRDIALADVEIAAASTVIVKHALHVVSSMALEQLKEIIINSDLGYLVLSELPRETVIVAIFSAEVPVGLMIRDFMSMRNEIVEILST